MNPFRASNEQIIAAGNQSEYYQEVWEQNQTALYDMYMQELNCTPTDSNCTQDALTQSINAATGSGSCSVNTGASAWFWFIGT